MHRQFGMFLSVWLLAATPSAGQSGPTHNDRNVRAARKGVDYTGDQTVD
jgi:hypothetical protein